MSISFNQIPNLLLVPGVYIEYDNSRAVRGLAPLPNRVILIGSMFSSGSAEAGQLKQITKKGDGWTFWGIGSQLGWMAEKFKGASKFTEVWGIGLEDADGATAAAKTITVTGTATSAGVFNLLLHGVRAPVGIAIDDTPLAQSTKIANVIAANPTLMFLASFGMTATVGGDPANGDYDLIFTGFGLSSPVTVRVTRDTTPADNDALAAALRAAIVAESDLDDVVVASSVAENVVSFRIAGGLASGTVTTDAPEGASITVAGTGVTHLLAKHGGAFTSDLDVRINYFDREELEMPDGVEIAIANAVTGLLDPDIEDAIAGIGGEFFTAWVSGYSGSANIAALETELLSRFGPMIQKDGTAIVGITGTFSSMSSVGSARNSPMSVLLGTGDMPTPPWEVAAVTAAVSSNVPDPGTPRQNLPLPGVLPPAREDRFDDPERNELLKAGISTFTVDAGGTMLIERMRTTYRTDTAGLPDASYRNYETMLVIAALRFTSRAHFTSKYPNHKLADDGTNFAPGQKVLTPSVGRGELLFLFGLWEQRAWVQNRAQFEEELLVVRNTDDRDRLDAIIPPTIINQARVIAAQLQFGL